MSRQAWALAVIEADAAAANTARRADPYTSAETVRACMQESTKARAAIAEWMEHDKALREALGTCERWFTKHSPTAPLIGGHGEAEHPMLTMLRAALRAVGGAK